MKSRRKKSDDEIISYITQPRIELVGREQCVIDGLKGIAEYSSNRIKINLGKYCVAVNGDELYIDSFSHQGAIVQGTIVSLELVDND